MAQSREDANSTKATNQSLDSNQSQFLTRDSDADEEAGSHTAEIPKRSAIMRLMPYWVLAEWAKFSKDMIQTSNDSLR